MESCRQEVGGFFYALERILPSKSINCHSDRSASLKSLASNLSLFSRMHGFSFQLVIWPNYEQ
ncbi:hypothetical protein CHCC14820_0692 [Bacillus paralicheniformis]|uniref:Uncharacterized protein n=1 Tax=Bacillus paralicheniformis TaxID=1648923 RepID=A0A6I7TS99_9BACI|nr:hypothetical protein SC10_B2orf02664 [Bacillus paralicheniformis]OLF87618.1 hypothetical protein B4121_4070 [Bacillus paralicheniformis]OLG07111.1 hypothetical protein B4125_1292 [Bacillus paralicheniformis]OMI13668.1 hypothetical protein BVL54_05140 [Bacillus paralicheniformis]TWJ45449.1 hypothetical protein CHCC5027_2190 [Bacillus paralicheniformis]